MGINKTPFVICKRGEYIISETMNQIEIIGIRVVDIWYNALKLFLFRNGFNIKSDLLTSFI